MLIDWFTIGAQALNFLILVWLMRHFLYKPIINAIDARDKLIAAELADAAAKKAEAQKDRDEFKHKNQEFDQQRAALLSKATDEANAERARLLDEARKAADALTAKRQETLRNDVRNLNHAIARRTQEEVFAITRKTLGDLATTTLEERMGEVFTRRLREMDSKAKEALGAALKTTPEPAVVRSTFELPVEERAKIQNAVNETFSADVHLRFETSPDLVSGLELTANGQKVAWSIAGYLASLEKGVEELLKGRDKPEPEAAPKPEANAEEKPRPETKATAQTSSKPDGKKELKPAAAPPPEAKKEPVPDAEPEAESKTSAKADVKPTAKEEPPAEANAAPASEIKTKATSEAKTAPAPDANSASAVNAKTEPVAEAPSKPKVGTTANLAPGEAKAAQVGS
jgi:F-type H+-transporting ATPase subunit b